MRCGGHNEVGRIERLLLKHPKDAFVSQDAIDRQWRNLGYTEPPDMKIALAEYHEFVSLLSQHVTTVDFLPRNDASGLDSIYVRDATIMTKRGAILCNMGKVSRQAEPWATAEFLAGIGVPILGQITGDGHLEGGDLIWIDERTLAVGRGYRTNDDGIRQLKELTAGFVDELLVVPLPHWRGPSDVFHLMSIISPIDHKLMLVYSPLLPVPFREWLLDRGVTLLEVPDSEFETMGCNVLALAPRLCLMLGGNHHTKRVLEEAGVEVLIYAGNEISRKGAGGLTCLTRPVLRVE